MALFIFKPENILYLSSLSKILGLLCKIIPINLISHNYLF